MWCWVQRSEHSDTEQLSLWMELSCSDYKSCIYVILRSQSGHLVCLMSFCKVFFIKKKNLTLQNIFIQKLQFQHFFWVLWNLLFLISGGPCCEIDRSQTAQIEAFLLHRDFKCGMHSAQKHRLVHITFTIVFKFFAIVKIHLRCSRSPFDFLSHL